ncbi:MAG: sigma-70 family RNA polymerase sigma factor [Acidobacteriota bacterium]|nr:MAG: sigma-70 family RNA polymerase sigma factor [Acidobacteriota bacterium]
MTPERERQLGEWMGRAQDGDQQAYESLLRELVGLLRAHALRRGARADWVDDVIQETLLSIHRARHTYDPQRPFLPWLYAIADRRLNDAYRRLHRVMRRESEEDFEFADAAVLPQTGDDELTEEVRQAVAELPERQREVIELLKLQEMSVKQVASRLGMSESAVKVTAHRGYKKLRERLRGLIGGN